MSSSYEFINGFTIRKKYYDESITLLIMSITLIFTQIMGTIIHECGHALTVLLFGGIVYGIEIDLNHGCCYWSLSHGTNIQKALVALMGTGSIVLFILIVCVPLYRKAQNLYFKMISFWGIVFLAQQLFYWASGAIFGGISFPWRTEPNYSIDGVYFASQLSISPIIVGLFFIPLWIFALKKQNKFLEDFKSNYFTDFDLTGTILKKFINIYVVTIQIFNSLAFMGLLII
ncbi:MAG: M50 family metallopeptidase [Promethearchaeota archaeon]